ncbi:hypothetical protein KFL_003000080 [Klebsormidium nitens]|uniref:Uncharacterized protein n=1 Tax=Klebsormidium nitens TaxID=105231 RepID=A0A1Y1I6N1_KLENI|nr:hypothetical protein KFL_003000080 [Klebsormidium nitens]|eukprot:GAQ86615.1 hypothetical protein KFL_003000080 [Klebsormidium nitens]
MIPGRQITVDPALSRPGAGAAESESDSSLEFDLVGERFLATEVTSVCASQQRFTTERERERHRGGSGAKIFPSGVRDGEKVQRNMAMNSVHAPTFALFLLLGTLCAGLAAAQSPSNSTPGVPSTGCTCTCPPSTTCSELQGRCDWYFLGSGPGSPTPTFNLRDGQGDHAISPPITYKDGQTVLAANTNGGYTYTGAAIPNESQNQFYGNGAYVYYRTFNYPLSVENYKGRCFLLPLTEIELGDGSNLNRGDGNAAYLESRRCVVFATQA